MHKCVSTDVSLLALTLLTNACCPDKCQ